MRVVIGRELARARAAAGGVRQNFPSHQSFLPQYSGVVAQQAIAEEARAQQGGGGGGGSSNRVPGAPTSVSAVAGDTNAIITFTPPADNGGAAIIDYTVTSIPGDITATGLASPITITGLTNGVSYRFTVTARNSVGLSAQSSPSNAVTPYTISRPSPPTLVYALPGNSMAYIYFTANDSNPPTITDYEYTLDNGASWTSTNDIKSPIAITGLTNGLDVTVKLRAVNPAGESTASNEITASARSPIVYTPQLYYDPSDGSTYSGSGGQVRSVGTDTMTSTTFGATWDTDASLNRKVFNFNGFQRIEFGRYNFGQAFTIAAWVYPRAKSNINGVLANHGPYGYGGGSGNPGVKFGWNYWTSPSTQNNALLFEAGDLSGWSATATETNVISLNQWQHITAVYSDACDNVVLYHNGIPANMPSIGVVDGIDSDNPNFNIGQYIGSSYGMNGNLGYLKVFKSSLNAADVYADYNSSRGEFGFGTTIRVLFTSVGSHTWDAPPGVTSVNYLIVGGGGGSGGGYNTGGGGGGGGGMVRIGVLDVTPGTTYTIVVGDGGAGGISDHTSQTETSGISGENSQFHTISSLGGRGGFASRHPSGSVNGNGGAAADNGASTASSGGNGGGSNSGGGGGGGSGGPGSNKSGATGGNGGSGTPNSITGKSVIYGAGGRGGNGGVNYNSVAGAVNTGNGASGGGATSSSERNGAKGGSGIVVITYIA